MNNLQKIATDISGYSLTDEAGARNDYFYDLETYKEQLEFIKDYSNTVDDVMPLDDREARQIVNYLTADFDCGDDRWYALNELGWNG